MAVDAKELAERIRDLIRCQGEELAPVRLNDCPCVAIGLLAEAVEIFAGKWPPTTAVANDWLRRVAEAHAEEGEDDGK